MTASQKHNELAREFVEKVAAETDTHAEMMVVVESMVLAAMLITQRRHGYTPAATVEFIDMAVHQATERFAAREV